MNNYGCHSVSARFQYLKVFDSDVVQTCQNNNHQGVGSLGGNVAVKQAKVGGISNRISQVAVKTNT